MKQSKFSPVSGLHTVTLSKRAGNTLRQLTEEGLNSLGATGTQVIFVDVHGLQANLKDIRNQELRDMINQASKEEYSWLLIEHDSEA